MKKLWKIIIINIYCYNLSCNPCERALDLLERFPKYIYWEMLSTNENPRALKLLEKNQDSIDWFRLSANPALFELDYQQMAKDRTDIIREELIAEVWHPNRLKQLGVFDINSNNEVVASE